MSRFSRERYATDAESLARDLLGRVLVRVLADGTRLAGRIVETEAYLGIEDRAAHSFGGRRTPRVESMYAQPGTAYIYLIYGVHHCVNVVCGEVDEPTAVLIRALEPIENMVQMELFRKASAGRAVAERSIANGPGKLCAAMAIDLGLDAEDMVRSSRLWVEEGEAVPCEAVVRTPRVGLGDVGDWAEKPLQWSIAENPWVSRGVSGGSGR